MRWLILLGILAALWWFFCRRRGDGLSEGPSVIGARSRRVLFALGRLPGEMVAPGGPADVSATTNYGSAFGCGCGK